MEMETAGFWDTLVGLLGDEGMRGVISGGLIALLSFPNRAIGELFKLLPDTLMPPEAIPPALALLGLVAGILLGIYTPLPMDLSIAVGMGAGWASGATHDKYKGNK